MNANSIITKAYEENRRFLLEKNKLNQSQFQKLARPGSGESGYEFSRMTLFFALWAVFLGLEGPFCRCTDKRMFQVEICGVLSSAFLIRVCVKEWNLQICLISETTL